MGVRVLETRNTGVSPSPNATATRKVSTRGKSKLYQLINIESVGAISSATIATMVEFIERGVEGST